MTTARERYRDYRLFFAVAGLGDYREVVEAERVRGLDVCLLSGCDTRLQFRTVRGYCGYHGQGMRALMNQARHDVLYEEDAGYRERWDAERRAHDAERRAMQSEHLRRSAAVRAWSSVLSLFQFNLCAWCGRAMGEDISVDHIVHVSKGGSDDFENLQAVHRGCNSQRGNRVASRSAEEARELEGWR